MSGSTPDAESFLGWKNIGEVKVWAIKSEPTSRPLSFVMDPFACSGKNSWASPVTIKGNSSPHTTSDSNASLIVGT